MLSFFLHRSCSLSSINDLADNCIYEEVAFLLIYGHLPDSAELDAYKRKLAAHRELPVPLRRCLEQIPAGAVPNQSGTWWTGRGGWCPGMQVDPFVVDVTAEVTAGQNATVSYRGLYNGGDIPGNSGNIHMSSYLVVYK